MRIIFIWLFDKSYLIEHTNFSKVKSLSGNDKYRIGL